MYVIIIDVDDLLLNVNYHENEYNAVVEFMQKNEFSLVHKNMYLCAKEIGIVKCIGIVQELGNFSSWLCVSVKSITLYKIEERIDLMPILTETKTV